MRENMPYISICNVNIREIATLEPDERVTYLMNLVEKTSIQSKKNLRKARFELEHAKKLEKKWITLK